MFILGLLGGSPDPKNAGLTCSGNRGPGNKKGDLSVALAKLWSHAVWDYRGRLTARAKAMLRGHV